MQITIEEKKQKALELMKKLDIYKPYIKGFEKDKSKIKQDEKKNGTLFFDKYKKAKKTKTQTTGTAKGYR